MASKTVAELKAEYQKLAGKCADAVKDLAKREPEVRKAVEAQLTKLGLNLKELVAAKREAFMKWEAAAKAEAAAAAPLHRPRRRSRR